MPDADGLLLKALTCPGACQDARHKLTEAVRQLRDIDKAQGGGLTALADITYLYAATQHWFFAERDYKVGPLPAQGPGNRAGAGAGYGIQWLLATPFPLSKDVPIPIMTGFANVIALGPY